MLTARIQNVLNKQQIIIPGDLNARVGRRISDNVVGRFGEKVVNYSGEKLIEFCKQHELQLTNSHFNHKEIHRLT